MTRAAYAYKQPLARQARLWSCCSVAYELQQQRGLRAPRRVRGPARRRARAGGAAAFGAGCGACAGRSSYPGKVASFRAVKACVERHHHHLHDPRTNYSARPACKPVRGRSRPSTAEPRSVSEGSEGLMGCVPDPCLAVRTKTRLRTRMGRAWHGHWTFRGTNNPIHR